ncbi:MAG: hypothetical protein ABFS34_13530 [Gemmatimonadota bacterium]
MLLNDPRAVRGTVRRLLARSHRADLAIARIRLAALRFGARDLARVRVRLLLGRLDVDTVAGAPGAAVFDDRRKAELERLRGVLRSGRIQVRAAGMVRWDPDFSVFRRTGGPDSGTVLVGSHRFDVPHPGAVPTLCGILAHHHAILRAEERFERLWDEGYDVHDVVREMLDWLLG